jgi:putative FmdB family regulatory protein
MPIYEYKCEDCGTKFEKLVRGSSTAVACPSCGQDHLQQEYSTFAARANGVSQEAAPMQGGCPAGMCGNPGLCGRN